MASGLLLLLDDIATIMDDVAVLTKTTMSKTAGVVGDDLALNAQQVLGAAPSRELPIVWSVAKGSALNKLILIPSALFLSWAAPWSITPLLILGGGFLCYEGCEKIVHHFLHKKTDAEHSARVQHLTDTKPTSASHAELEKNKINGAIRTDFILSAEIVVIALGIVASASFVTQVAVLVAIGVFMTVGVYGLVAAIVKIDDLGAHLASKSGFRKSLGIFLLRFAPYLMKFLSIAGTAAMFIVGGGILVHKVDLIHRWVDGISHGLHEHLGSHRVLDTVLSLTLEAIVGLVAGAFIVAVVTLIRQSASMAMRKAK